MAIYANSEKNLAGTDRNNIVSARRISGRRPGFSTCSFHLYTVLVRCLIPTPHSTRMALTEYTEGGGPDYFPGNNEFREFHLDFLAANCSNDIEGKLKNTYQRDNG